jgi:F0F1-type ATP synthase assembly protein I
MNQSFRQFVFSQEEVVSTLREEVSEGAWNLLEWPIGVTLALLLAGLLYTQEELPSALSALVGGVPVLLPTIFKLLDLFKNEKPSTSAS